MKPAPVGRYLLGAARLFLFPLLLAGCMQHLPETAVEQKSAAARAPDKPDESQTLRGVGEPDVVTLPIGKRLLESRSMDDSPLPDDVFVQRTDFNGVPIIAALQAVLTGTDISLSWNPDDDFTSNPVTILNLSGPLDTVVNRICAAGRVYCRHKDGVLQVKETETFIIELPPIPEEAENTIAEAIGKLAGDEASVDKDGGNLIYTTDAEGENRVRQYLSLLRRGRPLIVMQMYIWEVRLTDGAEAGVKWNSSSLGDLTSGGTKITPITGGNGLGGIDAAAVQSGAIAGGASFGAVFSGTVDAAAVFSFLQTNGAVETISNPQLTFVSGTKSEFSIGGKQNYISGVGQLVGSSVSTGGSSNNTGIGQNTVQTEEIETGLTVKISGSYEGGVIFGDMSIEDVTLLGFDSIPSSGTTIQLPRTQERKLATVIRLRPGDTLLMAGLRSSSDDKTLTGIPTGIFGILPFNSKKTIENREMVIMLRPAIIRFTDEPGLDRVEPTKVPSEKRKPQQPVAVPSTLPLATPLPEPTPVAATPAAAPVNTFPKMPEGAAVETLPANAGAIDDNGRVSANNLQRALGDASSGATIEAAPTRIKP